MQIDAHRWAMEEFGEAKLGDARRKRRLVAMARELLKHPTAVVAGAFRGEAARQGAYDFLEGSSVQSSAIEEASGTSCAARSATEEFVFVAVDGTTISLSDPRGLKEIGEVGVGSEGRRGRGVKVITAFAVDPNGVAVGVAGQAYWLRAPSPTPTPTCSAQRLAQRKRADRKRPRHLREVQHWVKLIKRVGARFKDAAARPWFVIDREGDAHPILDGLLSTGELFTVRASHDRVVSDVIPERVTAPNPRSSRSRHKRHLRAAMRDRRILGRYEIDVPAGPNRTARRAKLVVRSHRLTIHARPVRDVLDLIPISVVWLREEGTTPAGETPIDWMLLSNHPLDSAADVERIVHSYIYRWRIEEFHKTWKSAGCAIERTQLRRADGIMKWSMILASVAARIERIKRLARSEPDLPATVEFSEYELKAILLLKRKEKKRTEVVDDNPTIALATRWVADLGGYTGKSSGGPPGAITIGRGLERVRIAAEVIEELDCQRRRNRRNG